MCSKRHFDLTPWRLQTFSRWPHQGLKWRGVPRGSTRWLIYVFVLMWLWYLFSYFMSGFLSFNFLSVLCAVDLFSFVIAFKNCCGSKCEVSTLTFFLIPVSHFSHCFSNRIVVKLLLCDSTFILFDMTWTWLFVTMVVVYAMLQTCSCLNYYLGLNIHQIQQPNPLNVTVIYMYPSPYC